MALRNSHFGAALASAILLAACSGSVGETPSAATAVPVTTSDDSPVTSSPQDDDSSVVPSTSEPPETTTSTAPTPTVATTTTTIAPYIPISDAIDPATGAPQSFIDWLNERGTSFDDYLEWYPTIDLSYRQPANPGEIAVTPLPADYRAPVGWVTTETWPEDADLGESYADPRTNAFAWESNSRTIEGWYADYISPPLNASATTAYELTDGFYAVWSISWDRANPQEVSAYVTEFVDCGDIRVAFDTWCSDNEYTKGWYEARLTGIWVTVPLDDQLTVQSTSHVPCPGDQWLCWNTKIGQGPDFEDQLEAFDNDLQEFVFGPNAAGTDWLEIGNSLGEGPFSSAPETYSEITIWSRENLPAITLKTFGPYLESSNGEPTAMAVEPFADWSYSYEDSATTTCSAFRITDSGNSIPIDVRETDYVPCSASMIPKSVSDVFRSAQGSLHLDGDRIGINITWETTGG